MERKLDRRRTGAVIAGFVVFPFLLYVGAYFAVAEPVLFGPCDEGAPCIGPIDAKWGNSFFEQATQIERERLRAKS